jgi:acyl-CoA synthetase (AMP-forming)/AMP-acid ligase II
MPGDVVSTQLPNGADMVVLHLAVELAGGMHNPLAVQFREHELSQIAGLVRPTLVIHPGPLDGIDYSAIHARADLGESATVGPVSDFVASAGAPAVKPGSVPEHRLADPRSGTVILNTSGTVAMKGILHTHEDLTYSIRAVGERIGFSGDDTVVCAIPMTWGGGLAWGIRIAMQYGATLISVAKWDPVKVADTIDAEGATFIYGPPTLARDLVSLAPDWKPARPLKMICAGAPIPRQLVRDARAAGISLFPGYGQTEHLHSTVCGRDDPEERLYTTDGFALEGVELRIVTEEREPVETGHVGEIECRGPNVAREYFNQPDLSADTFHRQTDSWQVTQDLGSLDAGGYLRVGGRKRDIIIRGGLNVSPREVEELVALQPGIKEAAVVGYPDARYGERICAFVVTESGAAPGVDEVSKAFSDMGVARYKHPERIEIIDSLPVSSVGKIRHDALRELLRAKDESQD